MDCSQPTAKTVHARGDRVLPDVITLHRELRRKGVTLQLLWEEYTAAHPDQPTYRYNQFVEAFAGPARHFREPLLSKYHSGGQ
ncbi:hypothetical protein GRW89_04610 [Pseudomonas moraviensis]|jgi:transposase|uniref:hypothetical protein n=1 Tax=Pseudomonas TaxID=286 RepID=UPI00135E97BC|nr:MULTISPECIES: hypothetical protein [Pseudomonas]MXI45785.1 hypothetical protein [Pseudomonas moraviensis]WLG65241.1 hypothetical protein PSH90_27030 [Pseudomonas sp. FP1762]